MMALNCRCWGGRIEFALIKNDGCVAKDEIDGVIDIAFSVELAERMDAKSVLIAVEAATIECG